MYSQLGEMKFWLTKDYSMLIQHKFVWATMNAKRIYTNKTWTMPVLPVYLKPYWFNGLKSDGYAGVACNYVLYAILHGGHYCMCNNVRRTVLHMQSCPPGRCCIMQLCPPGHICICSCVRPVQKRPCSKLKALVDGTRSPFYKLSASMTWEMFGRWVFAAIIKYMNILHNT